MNQYEYPPARAQIGNFNGATQQASGTSGLVPAPSSGDNDKFLKGDGTWDSVPSPAGKVDIAQGVGNAGKVMRVNSSGNLEPDDEQDISGKLDIEQGSANAGKVMRVNSSGELEPDDEQDISGKVNIAQGSTNAGKILRIGSDGNLAVDGTMTILSYGHSTWSDFTTAYSSKSVVYCRASSSSNPASGSQTRLAFMAYVNNADNPTEVEFQYYRSVSSHTASQQGDQVFVYKLTSNGTWTVTTREASVKVVAGSNISGSYSNGTMTLSGNYSAFSSGNSGLVPAPASGDSGKFLKGDGSWSDVPAPSVMTGATSSSAGTSGLVPAPASGDNGKFLNGDGTWSQPPQRSDSSIVDLIYPVGSIYMSVASTSPSTLFGGTWQQLEDRFLVGASADNAESPAYPAGTTGGAASQNYTPVGTVGGHTLTTNEIPSHNHTFTGTEVDTGIQSADHTHNYTDYYATTTGNCAISVAQMPSHNHKPQDYWNTAKSTGGERDCWAVNGDGTGLSTVLNNRGYSSSTGSTNNHNHSGNNTSATRTSQGISANHSHKVTANGTIGNSGGGEAHTHGFTGTEATIATIPPYLAVYMWKRTA